FDVNQVNSSSKPKPKRTPVKMPEELEKALKSQPNVVGGLPESYPFTPTELHPLAFRCKKAGDL
ncbi:MAG: hypothetical protein ACXW4Q_16650, partial [Anaerolineales bacterium]